MGGVLWSLFFIVSSSRSYTKVRPLVLAPLPVDAGRSRTFSIGNESRSEDGDHDSRSLGGSTNEDAVVASPAPSYTAG